MAANDAPRRTSEFSGGDVVYGYCPVVAARTKLDLARDDVKPWVAIAQGHHESSLIWRRRFPDVAIRGFEQRTTLLLDVEVLGAEDLDCRARSEEIATNGARNAPCNAPSAVENVTASSSRRRCSW